MSRSGYSDDFCDYWPLIRWRGAVQSAISGKRGQAFMKEMLAALDALPEKRLIAEDLQTDEGVCAIGSVGACRGVDMSNLDPEESQSIAEAFGVANALVCEIEYMNDEGVYKETPEARFQRMRAWVDSQIAKPIEGAP